ncbi:Type II/IV secretion system ATP hydrolase TadA/VirB11/CpaF, TadA subfamily [Nitrospira tepida]|uniref:Type II/IV secretion system ATP hydrolase TadA/VirB11/CpaF, TadA subfamily n=1 Tax=Nitrospira tepida TaxID=2973512 RepID=A0AA86TAS9_9BACT|nr:CpaF family protein [Nitrospira tepida]CAI4031013.1 Type II/IV secretion system ATP hydrolase TadA/VirB11/CpaF, TadA subfamily [Nitrospira tepida]
MLTMKQMNGAEASSHYQALKDRLHQRVIELLDLNAVSAMPQEAVTAQLTKLIEQLLQQESVPLNQRERAQITQDILHEVLGLGPLEPLLADPSVADILVNGHKQVFVERYGRLELTPVRFKDDAHLKKIIEKIVSRVGRRIDESVPMVDARLADGSRVNAIIPPLAIDGPSLSIRKFSKDPLQLYHLIEKRSLTPEIGELLKAIVQARLNVLISGGTGSGKTTLLNVLSGFIPNNERIVTIEDAAELQLRQDHVVRLETRPANIEGKGEIAQRELVKNALRMRPDRIILGEVRGAESLDMLQAMNTGHDGSLTTVHANSPRDALTRIETLVSMAGLNLATKAMRHYVSSALDVIIQIARLSDGTRKLISLQEVVGMEGDLITLQELFVFQQTGLDENRKVKGRFKATGVRPKFTERLTAKGVALPADLFDPLKVYEC